jgi:hypothetical protein
VRLVGFDGEAVERLLDLDARYALQRTEKMGLTPFRVDTAAPWGKDSRRKFSSWNAGDVIPVKTMGS